MTNLDEARSLLARLVAFPTVSRDTNLPLIDWVEGWLAGLGVRSQRVWNADRTKANLYAQIGPDVPGGVVLSGHTDVVPVDGQAWTSDPWMVAERDGRLYGRGTCDMKGFVALALAAVPMALAAGVKRPLQLALSYDEELGCDGCIGMVEEMARLLPRAAAVIVGEPSRMKVVTGHKGGLGYKVHLKGYEVHSSRIDRGVSAVMEAGRLIGWVNARNAENRARTPGPLAAPFEPPWTTLHVGRIAGGTADNITAGDCDMTIDVRTVPGEASADWQAAFEAEAARVEAGMRAVHPGCSITLDRYFDMPMLRPESGGAAEALARRLTGDNASHVVSYGTEGGHFQRAGYSAVVCGPGDIAQAHQPDEYLELSEFRAGLDFMARLVADLAT
ncbi:MAG: acetylornithine deacetylase [Paracoccaceae bacterium]